MLALARLTAVVPPSCLMLTPLAVVALSASFLHMADALNKTKHVLNLCHPWTASPQNDDFSNRIRDGSVLFYFMDDAMLFEVSILHYVYALS